jgi:hypothetical protein
LEKLAQPAAEIILDEEGGTQVGGGRAIGFHPRPHQGPHGAVVAGHILVCGGSFLPAIRVLVFLGCKN